MLNLGPDAPSRCGFAERREPLEVVMSRAKREPDFERQCFARASRRSGERAFESGPVGRPAVRREHVLDRQCE